jgi:phosphoribosylamine-glycine ligase
MANDINSIVAIHETALKTGKFVRIADGTPEAATHAREILNRTQAETLEPRL